MNHQVVTASRLRDGRAVYLTVGNTWSEKIAGSLVSSSENESEAMLADAHAAADSQVVVDPYLIDVALDDALPRPVAMREKIRATGPTVDYGISQNDIRRVA